MNADGGMELYLYVFITSALDGSESCERQAPAILPHSDIHFTGA
jgi:hypothetical protein